MKALYPYLLLPFFLLALSACIVSTETKQGPAGKDGEDGKDGVSAIIPASCDVGDYVTGIDTAGVLLCSSGPDLSTIQVLQDQVEILETQLEMAQSQIDSIQDRLDAENVEVVPPSENGPMFSFTIPQSKLGGAFRTVFLTVRASGASCILSSTYLVHTGADNTGASVELIGTGQSYNVGSIGVTSASGFGNSVPGDDDMAKGVTVAFSAMPSPFAYRYTIRRIGTQ